MEISQETVRAALKALDAKLQDRKMQLVEMQEFTRAQPLMMAHHIILYMLTGRPVKMKPGENSEAAIEGTIVQLEKGVEAYAAAGGQLSDCTEILGTISELSYN